MEKIQIAEHGKKKNKFFNPSKIFRKIFWIFMALWCVSLCLEWRFFKKVCFKAGIFFVSELLKVFRYRKIDWRIFSLNFGTEHERVMLPDSVFSFFALEWASIAAKPRENSRENSTQGHHIHSTLPIKSFSSQFSSFTPCTPIKVKELLLSAALRNTILEKFTELNHIDVGREHKKIHEVYKIRGLKALESISRMKKEIPRIFLTGRR